MMTALIFMVATLLRWCYNYPDWWRSAIPLGALSYIQVVPKSIGYASSPFASSWTSASTARLYFFDSNNRIDSLVWSTAGNSSNLTSVGGYSSAVAPDIYLTDASFPSEPSTFINIGPLWVNVGKTYRVALSSFQNIVTGWPYSASVSPTLGVGLSTAYLTNLSSDRLVMGVRVNDGSYCMMTAEFTFGLMLISFLPVLKLAMSFQRILMLLTICVNPLLTSFRSRRKH